MLEYRCFSVIKPFIAILLCSTFILTNSVGVLADDDKEKYEFSIPAQPLARALEAFSLVTRRSVITNSDVVKGARSNAVVGTFTASSALKQLVENTGLELVSINGKSFALRSTGVVDANAFSIPVLEEVLVIGTPQSRYIIDSTDPVSGLNIAFLDNPRNFSVIPEQLILDRKITDLNEALRIVPSFAESDGFGGTNNDFFLRGFRRSAVYRDGFRRVLSVRENLTNVEFTQVIRGAASITYGQVEPGGVVDVVTKKPLDEPRFAGELRYGEFDELLGLVDWSQPIGDRAGLRLVASKEDADSFRDGLKLERDAIAISGRIDLTPATRLDIGYEWRDESRPIDRGTITVPTVNGRVIVNDIISLPSSRRFGETFDSKSATFDFYELSLSHQFSDNWRLVATGAVEETAGDDLQVRPKELLIFSAEAPITDDGFFTGSPVAPKDIYDNPTDRLFLSRGVDGNIDENTKTSYVNLKLTGEFSTGPVKHRLAIGTDYRDSDSTARANAGLVRGDRSDGLRIPYFNIQQPAYGTLSTQLTFLTEKSNVTTSEDYGVYLSDYMQLTNRLGLLLGVRYSDTKGQIQFAGLEFSGPTADAVTPQVGFSYRWQDNVTFFASYAESFFPNRPGQENGLPKAIDPELGEQIEIGVKGDWLNGRLQSTLLTYQIDKTNVVQGLDNLGNTLIADGQQSKGVEASIVGQPLRGMNVIASWAYTDATLGDGNTPRNVADTTLSLYLSYEWQQGRWEGLGMGAGVYHSSDRYGDRENSWKLGAYTLADASVWYTLPSPDFIKRSGTIRLQLAMKNLFDEEYYPSSGGDLRVTIGQPRSFIASLSYEF